MATKEIKFTSTDLDAGTKRAIADDVLVQGARPLSWWRKQSNDMHTKFMNEMRTSIENGESVQRAATRVRGGTVRGVQVPGIMKATKAQANTLARTAINKVSNEARIQSFAANDRVIKALKQISTLDAVTSQTCIAYDGQVWENTARKKPVPPSTLPFNQGPPRHFNCRSTLVPVLKSWKELGIDADELSPSTRASMDGQVPADTTMDAFLRGKSKSFQDERLGKVKARLWRSKKISLSQLVDFRGNPLTDDQLLALVKKARATATAAAATAPAAAPAPKAPVDVPNEPKEATRWQRTSWNDAPKYVTDAVNKSPPLSSVTSKNDGAYFLPGKKVINMPKEGGPATSLRRQGTWRHEYGHHLDREWSENLTDATKKASRRHISASPAFKKAMAADTRSVNKGAGGKTPSAAHEAATEVFAKHLQKTMDEGTGYLDKQLKKHGLSYKGMRDLHRKHMDDSVDSKNDIVMRNKMVKLLAAIETKNAQFYINQLWEGGQYFQSGMAGKIADYYGSIALNRVGYGHSKSYYSEGIHKRTTEAFANAFAILGGEPGWQKVIRALGHDKFLNMVDDLIKNGGKV